MTHLFNYNQHQQIDINKLTANWLKTCFIYFLRTFLTFELDLNVN